jgi:hypothetical protein
LARWNRTRLPAGSPSTSSPTGSAEFLAAVTNGDLAAATNYLPANPQATAPSDQVVGAQHRQLAVAFLLAALTLIVLGLVLAVAR